MRPGAFLAIILLLGMSGPEVAHYVESTLPVGAGPIALCYDSQDCKIYCASELTPTMTVIDGVTNRILRTIPIGARARALCYNPQDNKVYCANWQDTSVTVIDGATNRVLTSIQVGVEPWALAWNPVQNRVYVANCYGSSISVLRDSGGVGTDENTIPQVASPDPAATVIRGVLVLGAVDSRQNTGYRAELLDAQYTLLSIGL